MAAGSSGALWLSWLPRLLGDGRPCPRQTGCEPHPGVSLLCGTHGFPQQPRHAGRVVPTGQMTGLRPERWSLVQGPRVNGYLGTPTWADAKEIVA